MKRILTLTAIAAASLLAFSCKSEPATGPIVEFGQIIYQVENGVSVDVSVVVSAPAEFSCLPAWICFVAKPHFCMSTIMVSLSFF